MNNKNIGIEKISYYLPENFITSSDLSSKYGYDKDFIETKVGVKKLFYSKNMSSTDMAEKSVELLLAGNENLRSKIGLLVVCTQTSEYQLPQVSSQLQYRCRLNNTLSAFDISLGCSGYVYGLSIVESMMDKLNIDYGVLVTTEKYSGIIDEHDKNTKCLFSDSSSATLISNNGKLIPGKYKFGTDGELFDSLIVNKKKDNNGCDKNILHMNGRNIFNFTVGKIPNELLKTCELNDTKVKEVDHFVIHQASSFVINSIASRLSSNNVDDKFVNYMHLFGNTVSSSIPISLSVLTNNLESNLGKIIISGFGVGLSWATTILFNRKKQ